MSISLMMLGLFSAILLLALVVAVFTGRAYYGQPFRYVDRDEHPIMFWVVVGFMVAVLAMSVWGLSERTGF